MMKGELDVLADGQTHLNWHDKLWGFAILFGISEALMLVWIPNYNIYLFMIFYLFWYWISERYISNDLDLISMSAQEGKLLELKEINFFLGLFGLAFMILSLCYAWAIPKHRSWWSHSVPIGTLIRCLWFIYFPIFVVMNLIASINGWKISEYYFQFYGDYWFSSFMLSSFLAMGFSDLIHLMLDSNWAKNRLYIPIRKRKDK